MNQDQLDIIETNTSFKVGTSHRFSLLWVVLLTSIAILLARSFYLQALRGDNFLSAAENNRVGIEILPAPRGIIYDRNRIALTENISSTDLIADPVLLPSSENEASLIEGLANALPDLEPAVIQQAITSARQTRRPTIIAKALDHEKVLRLEQVSANVPGVKLSSSLVRRYPHGQSIAHILGYASTVSAEDLESNEELYPTDTAGKNGVEKQYDSFLRGEHGRVLSEINASGHSQTNLGRQEPVAGQDIQLTVDIDLQNFVYSLFSEADSKRRLAGKPGAAGAAVVLDPRSGAVLALVSYPSFDPNAFSQPALTKESAKFFQDEQKPMFNRAVDGTYPSGSVIKPFIAAAALEENIITPQTTVLSTGGISVGPWRFGDWKAGGHGVTDVKKAIAESVNTFFYLISGGDEQREGLGVELINKYLHGFGWAEKTNIDLPSEATGFLPTPKWKEEVKKEPWYIGDTYHLGIGQGDVLVTPLQIATSTGGIANGQYIFQPHVVDNSTEKKSLPVSSEHIRTVREGMRFAVTAGSGRALSALPEAIAGKTGTAQIGGTEDTHAWFTSYAPEDNPELVVTVLLDRGGNGDVDAVPIAKEIWQWWIDNRGHI